MHFWSLSYQEYRDLPAGLYAEMAKLQKKAHDDSKSKR